MLSLDLKRTQSKALFPLGCLVMTRGIEALDLSGPDMARMLECHLTGRWGDLDDADKRANDEAVRDGDRILSCYHTTRGVKVWIITEADRSATTILLPEEY